MPYRTRVKDADEQAGLFEPVADRPMWTDLPSEVQRTVTTLLAQLLTQAPRRNGTCEAVEVENE